MAESVSRVNGKTPCGPSCVVPLPNKGLAGAEHAAAEHENGDAVMPDAVEPRVVGRVPFEDGVTRDVYEGADGRQWAVGYEGERAYGVWLPPADEPVVVTGRGERG